MSGFDPTFDAAGAGTRDGSVPAPGAIDGRTYFLRADKTWAAPGSLAPGPEPPAPGPDLDQWACNIAGYLTYEVSRLAVKYVVDWLPVSWIGDVAGGIVAGIAGVLLPASLLEGGVIEAAIFTWVSSYVSTHVADIGTALVDDVAWAKIHCALYDKIKLTPTDLHAAILAFTAILGGLVGWTTPAVAAISYLFEHLGIADVGNIPITAFVRAYDCSTCGVTGIGPTKPVLQTAFDLTVTDGSTADTFVDSIAFAHATISGSSPNAVHTPNTSTASQLGINKPDGSTIGVSSGVYSVLNGQLATINLDQLGTVVATASGGVTISGLVVGNTYALQSTGGPFYDSSGTSAPSYDWSASNDGGSTWQQVLFNAYAGPAGVVTPAWASSAALTDTLHARVVWVASATSIRFRVADSVYTDNHGSLGWQLLDVVYEGSSALYEHNGAKISTRPSLDFEDSATVTATVTDDPTNDRVSVSLYAPGLTNVTTTKGDLIVGNGSGAPARLPVGSANTLLQSVPAATDGVQWVLLQASDIPNLDTSKLTTGQVPAARGGTGIDSSAVDEGDLLVGTRSHTWVRGGIGGGNGITVSETGGIYTVAANVAAGTGVTITLVGGTLVIAAAGTGGGGTALTQLATIPALSGATATLAFTSIPAGYKGLKIVGAVGVASASSADRQMLLKINTDTGSHYQYASNFNNVTSTGQSFGSTGTTVMTIAEIELNNTNATALTGFELLIPDYADTSFNKTMISHSVVAHTGGFTGVSYWGGWLQTAAITDLTFTCANAKNFCIGSTLTLYGMA